jgi:hypothetical protein
LPGQGAPMARRRGMHFNEKSAEKQKTSWNKLFQLI